MSSRQSSRNASTPYLAKAFQATAIVVVSYFLYWTYQLYQYGEIPISKKDVMLRQAILARFPADYEVEIDLRQAQQHLGEITGAFTPDDLLGRIFSSFCIGK